MFHLVKSWGSLVSCHRANIGFDSDRMPNFRSRKLKPRTSLFFFLSYCLTFPQLKDEKHTVYKFQLFYIFLGVGSCLFFTRNSKTNRITLWEENSGLKSQNSQQKSVPELHGVTVAFLALKKWFFWKKSFQCGRYNVFNFFSHEKLKKHPKQFLRIGPDPFFPQSSPGHSPQPKIDFPY